MPLQFLHFYYLSKYRDSGRRPPFPKKCPETATYRLGGRPLAGVYYTTALVFEKRHFQSNFWVIYGRFTAFNHLFIHSTPLSEQIAKNSMPKFVLVNFLWIFENDWFNSVYDQSRPDRAMVHLRGAKQLPEGPCHSFVLRGHSLPGYGRDHLSQSGEKWEWYLAAPPNHLRKRVH